MKEKTSLKGILVLALVWVLLSSAQLSAQQRGRGINGDWLVKGESNGRIRESLISFSRDQEGNQTGHWISGFGGLSELKNIQFGAGKLSFAYDRRNRDGETSTSTFAGTIQDGQLTGTLSSDRGDYEVKGARRPRVPSAVGKWEMTFTPGDREITATLLIKAGVEGKLVAQWQNESGEHTVTGLTYERGELIFKNTSKMEDRQWESTFKGTLRGNRISGAFNSDRGEMEVRGQRIGGALIGTWMLETTSERGTRKQRLLINPDMSGLYGATPVKVIKFEDDKVSFKLVFAFGDRTFEMDFAGKLTQGKLTGELANDRFSQQITGTKIVRTRRRRDSR